MEEEENDDDDDDKILNNRPGNQGRHGGFYISTCGEVDLVNTSG